MPYSVKGKTAIVTGAGSGINFAFAKLLLENGCNVLIADLSLRSEAKALVEQYTGHFSSNRAVFKETDVVNWDQLDSMFATAEKEFGEIDVVCPGAAIYEPPWSNFWRPPGTPESKDSLSQSRYALLDINITHPIRTSQLAIAHFRQHKHTGAKKHILHISSIAGQVYVLAHPLYIASKHAINGFVRSLSPLDEAMGIRVTAVAPGIVKTPMWTDHPEKLRTFDPDIDQWVTADEVAHVMLALIQQDKVSEIIGDQEEARQTIPIKGGTILEVSKNVRPVTAFNDPGPVGRAGNTVSALHVLNQEVFDLLQAKDWGKVTLPKIE